MLLAVVTDLVYAVVAVPEGWNALYTVVVLAAVAAEVVVLLEPGAGPFTLTAHCTAGLALLGTKLYSDDMVFR